jgi:hypothetical protein
MQKFQLFPEDEGAMIFRNAGNFSPSVTASRRHGQRRQQHRWQRRKPCRNDVPETGSMSPSS